MCDLKTTAQLRWGWPRWSKDKCCKSGNPGPGHGCPQNRRVDHNASKPSPRFPSNVVVLTGHRLPTWGERQPNLARTPQQKGKGTFDPLAPPHVCTPCAVNMGFALQTLLGCSIPVLRILPRLSFSLPLYLPTYLFT